MLFIRNTKQSMAESRTNKNCYFCYLLRALKTTKFCLCPRGNKAWSPRLMDAVWFGCIPVVIADHYVLPLGDLVDWESIAVTVAEKQVRGGGGE